MQKSSNFDTFFKTDVFSCAFLHPAFFHIFAFTLRSKSCFDCKVEAPRNFHPYRFSLNGNPEVSLYRSAYGVWLPGECKLLHQVKTWFRSKGIGEKRKRSFRGFWGHCPHPCSQKLLFLLPSKWKLSFWIFWGTLPSPLQPETTFPSTLHDETKLGPEG